MANPDQDDAAANRGYVLSQVSFKADKSELTTKADKSDLIQKADKSEPVQKADITYVDTEFTKKADLSIINSELAIKADLSAVLVIDGSNPIIGDLDMGAIVSLISMSQMKMTPSTQPMLILSKNILLTS